MPEPIPTSRQVVAMIEDIATIKATLNGRMQSMENRINELHTDFKEIRYQYVTKDEFKPVRNVVYGLVGTILTGVTFALLTLIIMQK